VSEAVSRLQRAAALLWPALLLLPWYLLTLSPGLSWGNQSADSADLLNALALDTLPHPPGAPAWLLLIEGWLLLPWPDVPRAVALSSVLALTAALMLWHGLLRERVPDGPWAGVVVVAIGLQPLIWAQAVVVEIYALGLLAAVLYWRLWLRAQTQLPVALSVLGLTAGSLAGLHLTLLALLPTLLPLLRRAAWRGRAALLGGLLLGAAVWLLLPLRGAATTAAGWGAPISWDGFVWFASGAIYREAAFGLNGAALAARLADWATDARFAPLLPLLVLALIGARGRAAGGLPAWVVLLPALLIGGFALGYARNDAEVLLLVPIVALGLPAAGGLARLAARLPQRAQLPAALLLIGLLQLQAAVTRPLVDVAADPAQRIGTAILAAAPPQALLYTADDQSSFVLNYLHHVAGLRPDVVVVITPLLPYDWYRQRLAASYPQLQLPGALPSGWDAVLAQRNPTRPLCRVDAADMPPLRCRPPLE
jgi:hypothetical protein